LFFLFLTSVVLSVSRFYVSEFVHYRGKRKNKIRLNSCYLPYLFIGCHADCDVTMSCVMDILNLLKITQVTQSNVPRLRN
jgi:hypothetical protein